MKTKVQCPHSISRTCLAQEFGLVIVSTFNFQSIDRKDQGPPALPAGVQQRALCQAWSSSGEEGEKGETYFGMFKYSQILPN